MEINTQLIQNYLNKLTTSIKDIDNEEIKNLVKLLERKHKDRHQIFIVGNGGSSATSSHFVCDLAKTVLGKKPEKSEIKRFKVFSLTDNTPLVTAIGNDISYDHIFSEQLKKENEIIVNIQQYKCIFFIKYFILG